MSTPTKRILVVDDNPRNLKLAFDVLEDADYEVVEAVNAEEAQSMIDRNLPDFILMDIALPGMDGLTLTRKIKANERTKHIRIIALTAFAMKGDDQKALAAGCDGYITKPIDITNCQCKWRRFWEARVSPLNRKDSNCDRECSDSRRHCHEPEVAPGAVGGRRRHGVRSERWRRRSSRVEAAKGRCGNFGSSDAEHGWLPLLLRG